MILKINNKIYKFAVEIIRSPIDRNRLKTLTDFYNKTKPKGVLNRLEIEYVSKLRHEIKSEIKKIRNSSCEIKLNLGPYWMSFVHEGDVNKDVIKHHAETMITFLKEKRKKKKAYSKELRYATKNFMNIKYRTIGGVFEKPNSMLGHIIHTEDNIETDKIPYSKDDYVGVEIEMFSKFNRKELNKKFIDNKLTLKVKNKTDSSISPEDNKHPLETTVLFKYNETDTVIKKVCDILKEGEAKVNNSCGLHVHLDARNKNYDVMFHNLVSCLGVLNKLVPHNRINATHYCKQNTTTNMKATSDRYQAINPTSYAKYKTIEVRLHSGTVNATKIINFVHILQSIVNKKDKIKDLIDDINVFAETFNISNKLKEYMIKRSEVIAARKNLDTKMDIETDIMFEVAS